MWPYTGSPSPTLCCLHHSTSADILSTKEENVYWALQWKMLKEEAHQWPRHGYQEPRHLHVNNYQKMLDVPAFIPKPGILRLYLYKPSYLGFLISETWLTALQCGHGKQWGDRPQSKLLKFVSNNSIVNYYSTKSVMPSGYSKWHEKVQSKNGYNFLLLKVL